jgi:hypothetical protein
MMIAFSSSGREMFRTSGHVGIVGPRSLLLNDYRTQAARSATFSRARNYRFQAVVVQPQPGNGVIGRSDVARASLR